MNKRSREYFKWLRHLKEQALIDSGHYGMIPIIQKGYPLLAYASDIFEAHDKEIKRDRQYDFITFAGHTFDVFKLPESEASKTVTFVLKPENHFNNHPMREQIIASILNDTP